MVEAYKELISYLEILEQSHFMVPIHMANRYVRTGQHEKAMEYILKAVEVHDQNVPYIVSGFMKYDPVYGDPRFRALVEQLNLPMPEV